MVVYGKIRLKYGWNTKSQSDHVESDTCWLSDIDIVAKRVVFSCLSTMHCISIWSSCYQLNQVDIPLKFCELNTTILYRRKKSHRHGGTVIDSRFLYSSQSDGKAWRSFWDNSYLPQWQTVLHTYNQFVACYYFCLYCQYNLTTGVQTVRPTLKFRSKHFPSLPGPAWCL